MFTTFSLPVCVHAFRGIAAEEKRVNYFTSRKSCTPEKKKMKDREGKKEREIQIPGTR